MATVSKQTVNGVDYDIKDTAARTGIEELNSKGYVQKFVLPDNSDLDDLMDNKVYFVQSGASHIPANYPEEFGTSAGMIIASKMVNGDTSFGNQIAIQIPDGRAMFRSRNTSGWRDWVDMSAINATTVQNNISSFGETGDLYSSLADLPANTFFRTYNAPDRPEGQTAGAGFWVMTLKTAGANLWVQVGFGASSGIVRLRHRATASGDYSNWTAIAAEKVALKVLCIGNSFTLDNMSYLPYILKTIVPQIDLTLVFAFKPSAGIQDHIDAFDADSTVYYKCVHTSDSTAWEHTWGSGANATLKDILKSENWDFITFQQNSANQTTWSTFSNLNTLIDKVVNYINGQGKHPVRLGWLMPQLRTSQESRYDDAMDCVQKVLQTTPIDFVIPCGTAVENARGTSLQSLGDDGNLQYTDGHLQEGLPCMIGAYTAAIKMLELCGMSRMGIMGERTVPTASWLSDKNIPNPQGESCGATKANCYIAQKCAVAAIKFPYEVTTIAE